MNIVLLYQGLSTVFTVLLGFFILFRNPQSRINILYFLLCLFVAGYSGANWLIHYQTINNVAPLFAYRAAIFFASLQAPTIILFLWNFPRRSKGFYPWKEIIVVFIGVIFTAFAFSSFYLREIEVKGGILRKHFTLFYAIFAIYFCSFILYSLFHLYKKYALSKDIERKQIRLLLCGLIISYSIGSIFSLILPLLGYYTEPIGPIAPLILVIFVAIAITKANLMDISVIISRSLAEILTTFFYGAIYLILAWLHHFYISPSADIAFLVGTVLYGILVGQTYQFARLKVQTTSDKLILRGKYDYHKALAEIGTQITKVLSMENILNTLYQTFHEIIEVANPRVYLSADFPKPEVQKILGIKELTFEGNDLIIPCLIEDRLIALIVLSKKLSEDPYTDEDLKLLKALACQTAIAIDHTHTYEEIKKDFEANKEKLYDTERLLARSEKIASMASLIQEYNHEIRTPLGIMKSKIYLLPDDPTKIEDFKEIKKYLREQIDRASDIVDSTLRLSEPKARKEIELNLNEVIENALKIYKPLGIKLTKNLTPLPLIRGDLEDLQLVFINLFKNAGEAMSESGELKVTSYPVIKDNVICVEISDTGVGIPEENMEKIFEPFFSSHVTKGRGLGLSIVFRIIREHLGKIEVDSKVGTGSTFRVFLPALKS